MDVPAPARRPRTRGLVLAILGVVVLLAVIFGVTVMRQKAQFQEYRATTLEGPLPWEQAPMTLAQCVEYTVEWAMACPGVESWCANEAPRLTRACLDSRDRRPDCEALGDTVASTHFGYAECEALRESVEGRYTKRHHKKFCAAGYRAVAEFCRQTGGVGADSPAPR